MIGFEETKPKNSLPIFNPTEFIVADQNAESAASLEALIVSNINTGNQLYNSNQTIINNYNPTYTGITPIQATNNSNQVYNFISFPTELGKSYIVNINTTILNADYLSGLLDYPQQVSLWLSDNNAADPATDTSLTNRVWSNFYIYLTSTPNDYSGYSLAISANMYCVGTGNTKYVNVLGLVSNGTPYIINETGGNNYIYVYHN